MKNVKMKSIQSAQVKNVPVNKENIGRFIKRDVEALYSLAYEILSTPGIIDILAEKLHAKFLADVKKKEQEVLEEEVKSADHANV